jgi:hypothetical protein
MGKEVRERGGGTLRFKVWQGREASFGALGWKKTSVKKRAAIR